MAVTYWYYWNDTSGTTTTGGTWYGTSNWTDTATTTGGTWIRRTVRTVLVKAPKSWNKAIRAAYTRLVNDETDTGWTVTMWIKGKIKITDPNVEKRSMKNFIPLLKNRASPHDRDLIDKFFDEYGST